MPAGRDTNDSQRLAALVERRVADLERLGWAALVEREGEALHETVDLGGTAYVLESQVFWDHRKGGDIRILVDVFLPRRIVSRSLVVADSLVPRPPSG